MKLAFLFFFVVFLSCTLFAVAVQPDGEGTEANPYLVSNLGNLQWISENSSSWGSWLIQTSDIDASSTQTWNDGAGWNPIGYRVNSSDYCYFTGNYNGQEHVISNLFISRANSGRQGFFGVVSECIISNLYIANVSVVGSSDIGGLVGSSRNNSIITNCSTGGSVSGISYCGGLIGENSGCYVYNCYSTCLVTASSDNVGGLIGNNTGFNNGQLFSTVSGCHASGNVNGLHDSVGGLVGWNDEDSIIQKSYATGSVTGGAWYCGGLLGNNRNGEVRNCFASGSVNGRTRVGGAIGSSDSNDDHDNPSIIENCYSVGSVTGLSASGGFIGSSGDGEVINCFWDTQTSGLTTSAGGSGCTSSQMQDINNYLNAGWDFIGETGNGSEDIWDISSATNGGYPYLVLSSTPISDETHIPPSSLLSIYPNPFNPNTTIYFNLLNAGNVKLAVYNTKGQLVRMIFEEYKTPGEYRITWDGTDFNGIPVSSGVYLCRILTQYRHEIKKMMLQK